MLNYNFDFKLPIKKVSTRRVFMATAFVTSLLGSQADAHTINGAGNLPCTALANVKDREIAVAWVEGAQTIFQALLEVKGLPGNLNLTASGYGGNRPAIFIAQTVEKYCFAERRKGRFLSLYEASSDVFTIRANELTGAME